MPVATLFKGFIGHNVFVRKTLAIKYEVFVFFSALNRVQVRFLVSKAPNGGLAVCKAWIFELLFRLSASRINY